MNKTVGFIKHFAMYVLIVLIVGGGVMFWGSLAANNVPDVCSNIPVATGENNQVIVDTQKACNDAVAAMDGFYSKNIAWTSVTYNSMSDDEKDLIHLFVLVSLLVAFPMVRIGRALHDSFWKRSA